MLTLLSGINIGFIAGSSPKVHIRVILDSLFGQKKNYFLI